MGVLSKLVPAWCRSPVSTRPERLLRRQSVLSCYCGPVGSIRHQRRSENAKSPPQQHGVFIEEAFKVAPPLTRLFALDAYTEYDLLDDASSNSFRIVFMPLETRPGSTHLINETRHGSDGGGVEVYDPRTGNPLKFEYLPGTEMMARKIPGTF